MNNTRYSLFTFLLSQQIPQFNHNFYDLRTNLYSFSGWSRGFLNLPPTDTIDRVWKVAQWKGCTTHMVNIDEAKSQWKGKIEKRKVYSRLYPYLNISSREKKRLVGNREGSYDKLTTHDPER